jgi:hypothetical protein
MGGAGAGEAVLLPVFLFVWLMIIKDDRMKFAKF